MTNNIAWRESPGIRQGRKSLAEGEQLLFDAYSVGVGSRMSGDSRQAILLVAVGDI